MLLGIYFFIVIKQGRNYNKSKIFVNNQYLISCLYDLFNSIYIISATLLWFIIALGVMQ